MLPSSAQVRIDSIKKEASTRKGNGRWKESVQQTVADLVRDGMTTSQLNKEIDGAVSVETMNCWVQKWGKHGQVRVNPSCVVIDDKNRVRFNGRKSKRLIKNQVPFIRTIIEAPNHSVKRTALSTAIYGNTSSDTTVKLSQIATKLRAPLSKLGLRLEYSRKAQQYILVSPTPVQRPLNLQPRTAAAPVASAECGSFLTFGDGQRLPMTQAAAIIDKLHPRALDQASIVIDGKKVDYDTFMRIRSGKY
jgi:hypothetical protein